MGVGCYCMNIGGELDGEFSEAPLFNPLLVM
jgi:hypothetical protein